MKKKLLSVLLAVCMAVSLFSGLAVNASADWLEDLISKQTLGKYFDTELLEELGLENLDVSAILTAAATSETSGSFGAAGTNLQWSVDKTAKTLTITGAGAMEDFNFVDGTLPPWWNLACVLNIKTIAVADTVTGLGEFAFFALPNLTQVTLPAGMDALPRYVLAANGGLHFPALPETLAEIGDYALAACDTFPALALPESVRVLGSHVFAGCDGLTAAVLPDTVRSVGSYAFTSCDKLSSAVLPPDVTAVPKGCFRGCAALKTVTYRGTPAAIGEAAFQNCAALAAAPIPETVTEIGARAFQNCGALTAAALPEGLTALGEEAFSGCARLPAIALPAGVTTVPDGCFSGCAALADVTAAGPVTAVGSAAFSGCTALTAAPVPETVTEIGARAFALCTGLTELALPAGLTAIGESAFFGCTGLTLLDVPGGVETVSASAFSGCTGLTAAYFRAGVQTLRESAFAGCPALTDAYFYGNAPAVTDAAADGATFDSGIYVHYPQDDATWAVTDGYWHGYRAAPWNVCRHDLDGCTLTRGKTVAPTCTAEGYTVYTCDRCGAQLRRDVTPKVPHREAAEVVAPTCTEPGYTRHYCAVCGRTLALPDAPVAPTGHSYRLTETITAPTCTETGEGTYTCAACGDVQTLPIPAAGHMPKDAVIAPTCTENGYTKHICAVCGRELGPRTDETRATGHQWDGGTLIQAAGPVTEGRIRYTCTVCGTTRDVTVPATGVCDGGADCPGRQFRDMPRPGDWAHEGIDYCVANGLMNGMSATTFVPGGTTTRAMVVTILWRQQNSPDYTRYYQPFTDVQDGTYYAEAVAWAYHNDIVTGKTATMFDPNGAITREQMAAILLRYTQKYAPEQAEARAELSGFPDVQRVSPYAREAMSWAYACGYITGTAKGGAVYLDPQGLATRAQTATILARYCQSL